MEQVLFRLHVRLLAVTNRFVSYNFRKSMEYAILISGVASLGALFFLHATYVTNSSSAKLNCIINGLDRAGLMDRTRSVSQSFLLRHEIDLIALNSIDTGQDFRTQLLHLFRQEDESSHHPFVSQYTYTPGKPRNQSISNVVTYLGSPLTDFSERPLGSYVFAFHRGVLMLTQELDTYASFNIINVSFREDVDCLGPPAMRLLVKFVGYDIVIMNWIISAFGGVGHLYNVRTKDLFNLNYAADFVAKKGISEKDLGRRVRYDTNTARQHMKGMFSWGRNSVFTPVVMAFETSVGEILYIVYETFKSLAHIALRVFMNDHNLQLLETDMSVSTSYLYSIIVERWLQFQQFLAFRAGVIFSTTFLFFITTSLVSFILRQTQERMLRFTYLLQFHITNNLPYLPLVFTHVIESLVFVPIMMGIYFFLFEFFSDQLLAFLVLLVVWMGEVFSVLSLRSRTSIQYFPRFFVCYFALFHIYFFSYPFGFAYIALLTMALFVLGSMFHFWNTYEVPVFMSGRLTPLHPRIGFSIPGPLPPPAASSLIDSPPTARSEAGVSEEEDRRLRRSVRSHSTSSGNSVPGSPSITVAEGRSGRSHSVDDGRPPIPPGSGGRGGSSRHSIVLSNIYESVEARRMRLHQQPLNGLGSQFGASPTRSTVRSTPPTPPMNGTAASPPSFALPPPAVPPAEQVGLSIEQEEGSDLGFLYNSHLQASRPDRRTGRSYTRGIA